LAKLWTANITGNLLNTEEDFKRYQTLANVIYGHQASLGEYHKVPFNPPLLGYHFQLAGFKLGNILITVYPTNSPFTAPQKAYDHLRDQLKNSVVLTEMLWVEAIK
jgi:hypothetical protein